MGNVAKAQNSKIGKDTFALNLDLDGSLHSLSRSVFKWNT